LEQNVQRRGSECRLATLYSKPHERPCQIDPGQGKLYHDRTATSSVVEGAAHRTDQFSQFIPGTRETPSCLFVTSAASSAPARDGFYRSERPLCPSDTSGAEGSSRARKTPGGRGRGCGLLPSSPRYQPKSRPS
jgi:hypothetical protein